MFRPRRVTSRPRRAMSAARHPVLHHPRAVHLPPARLRHQAPAAAALAASRGPAVVAMMVAAPARRVQAALLVRQARVVHPVLRVPAVRRRRRRARLQAARPALVAPARVRADRRVAARQAVQALHRRPVHRRAVDRAAAAAGMTFRPRRWCCFLAPPQPACSPAVARPRKRR